MQALCVIDILQITFAPIDGVYPLELFYTPEPLVSDGFANGHTFASNYTIASESWIRAKGVKYERVLNHLIGTEWEFVPGSAHASRWKYAFMLNHLSRYESYPFYNELVKVYEAWMVGAM